MTPLFKPFVLSLRKAGAKHPEYHKTLMGYVDDMEKAPTTLDRLATCVNNMGNASNCRRNVREGSQVRYDDLLHQLVQDILRALQEQKNISERPAEDANVMYAISGFG